LGKIRYSGILLFQNIAAAKARWQFPRNNIVRERELLSPDIKKTSIGHASKFAMDKSSV